MTHCLNPNCQRPQNPGDANYCQNCGAKLLLGDRYRPLELIGRGGFGRTFLAVDSQEKDHPDCVIKQLLPRSGMNWDKAIALFRQESDRLAELGQHPQIPALYDHFEFDDAQYLVQEFIDGLNLEEILNEEGLFSEIEIRQLLADLLPVLSYIHSRRIIHRDIKPENILLPAPTGRYTLVDFGASKYTSTTDLKETGTLIGSAGYVAPEQAMGRAEFASDLFGLGVTCIHLLTGIHPFDLYSVSEDAWVWQQYLSQPVSLPLRRVLNKLIQKPTGQRYRTASAVIQDLNLVERAGAPAQRSRQSPPVSSHSRSNLTTPQADEEWHCIGTLVGHEGEITAIAIHPDSHLLASGSSDKSIKLWDLETGELQHTFVGRGWSGLKPDGHRTPITSLVFSPDGYTLFSGSQDGIIKEWDLQTYKLSMSLRSKGWDVSTLALSSDGWTLASAGAEGIIYLWDLESAEIVATLNKHSEKVSSLILSPDGYTLISSSFDQTILVWDLRRDLLLKTLKGHLDAVSAIAVSADWQRLISASWDRTIKIWDLKTGGQLRVLAAHRDQIHALATHPTEAMFASACQDGTVTLWQLETGDRLMNLAHAWSVKAIAFSPDGELLVTGSSDETIRVWQR
jgi:WD40 repeat protein